MIVPFLILFVQIFFSLLEWCILLQVIYSWVRPHSKSVFFLMISSVVVPLYRLIRRVIPPFGPLDLTPLFALLSIEILGYFIVRLLAQLI